MRTSSRFAAWRCAPRHAPLTVSLVLLLLLGLAGGLIVPAHAEPLEDSGATLPGLTNATTTWADYDTDGDLDLLLTGATTSDDRFIALYENDSGTLAAVSGTGLTGLSAAAAAWGDYDNDNDPDLLLAGTDATSTRQTILYRNNSDGTFTADSAATSAMPGLSGADAAWGDYDNDGDPDLLLAGDYDDGGVGAPLTGIYRNDGGTFTDANASIDSVSSDQVAWADYDNDGDLDALLSGSDGASTDTTRIYTNNGGAFSLDSAATGDLPDVLEGVIAWGDYDSDGDLDLFLGGTTSGTDDIARVYENDNGRFAQSMSLDLTDILVSDAAWLDYDSDGALDLVLSAIDIAPFPSEPTTRVYLNDEDVALPGDRILTNRVYEVAALDGSVAGADYDSDGDSDLVVAGNDGTTDITKLFDNTRTWDTFPLDDLATADLEAFPTGTPHTARMGDYDNDGDLDLLLVNQGDTLIYDNDGTGRFTRNSTHNNLAIINSDTSAADWGDYDGDGDLDIVLTGFHSGAPSTFVYQYDGGTYSEVTPPSPLQGVQYGAVAWSPPDANGQVYLAVTGQTDSFGARTALVYAADATNIFTLTTDLDSINGDGVEFGALDWGDYDKDGDPDLLLAGFTDLTNYITKVYRNDGGSFTEETIDPSGLEGVTDGAVAWVDFDSDDDLDIFVTGSDATTTIAGLYANDGSSVGGWTFTEESLPPEFYGVYGGSAEWADYDSDGDPDLLLAGVDSLTGTDDAIKVYRNDGDGGTEWNLTSVGTPLPRIDDGVARWGDYDGDGDFDIFVYGSDGGTSTDYVGLYENSPANDIPPAPDALASNASGDSVTLFWAAPFWSAGGVGQDDANYDRTPGDGFSYALRVGTTAGGSDIVSPLAASDGTRFLPQRGDIVGSDSGLSWQLSGLADGTYYWSVQAIDHALAGSAFAPAETFSIDTTPPSVTINQASGQDDPTNASVIFFDVAFSEAVTGFASSDVLLGGTANPTSASISGSGQLYTVEVSGMSASGTVTASIKAGAAQDNADNASLASTSTDNTVVYQEPDTPAPEIVVLDGSTSLTSGASVLDFGGTLVGAPLTRTLTVRNLGTADLTLGTPSVPAGFVLASGLLTDTLAPNATTSLTLTLEAAASGTYSGTFTLPTNDSDENPFRFEVQGSVTEQPEPEIVVLAGSTSLTSGASVLDFGGTLVGAPLTRTLTVRNLGTADLTLGTPSVPAGFVLASGSLTDTLAPNATTSLTLTLEAAASGTYSGTFTLPTNDSDENPFRFEVQGSVTEQPEPEIVVLDGSTSLTSGASVLDFGDTQKGTPLTRTLTVRNLGTADLTLGTPSVPTGFSLVRGFGADTLAPGADTTFVLRLDAALSGRYTETLTFATNDSDENPFSFEMRGNVANDGSPILTLTIENSANVVQVGDTLSFTVTLRNESGEVAVDVEVVIQLPQGVRFGTGPLLASAAGEGWACAYDDVAQTVTCTRDAAEPGTAPPITIDTTVEATDGSLQASASATARNSAGAVSGSGQGDPVNVTVPPNSEDQVFLPLIVR